MPEFVDTTGWKVHRIGDAAIVAPRRFAVASTNDSLSWEGRSIAFASDDGGEDAPGPGEDCGATLGGRDVLIVTRRSLRSVQLVAWYFGRAVDDEFGRDPGAMTLLTSDSPADEAMLWTILRGMHGPLPRPDLPHPEQADLADRECPVQLLIEARMPERPEARPWVAHWLTATLMNRGASPITLVAPGDGSDDDMRTPVTWMSIRRGRERVIPNPPRARCGNMNDLTASDLLELAPGQAVVLDGLWTDVTLARAGVYDVRVHYLNEPSRPWYQEASQDASLLARVRASQPCEIVSNSVRIRVTEADLKSASEP